MISTIIVWGFLAAVSLPPGAALAARDRTGNFWLSIWCGLFLQAFFLQVLSATLPLYPWGLIAMSGVALLALPLSWRTLVAWTCEIRRSQWPAPIAIIVVVIAIAYIETGRIIYYDSGLYHFPFMRWLSQDGLVPGLGLFQIHFSVPSDWFALAATFDAGPLSGYLAAAANGYVVLLMAGQALDSAWQLRTRRGSLSHRIIFIGFGVLLAQSIVAGTALSASPDLPVSTVTVLLGWVMLQDSASRREDHRHHFFIVGFLAAISVALKLSAAPLLVVTGIFCAWHLKKSPGVLLGVGLLVVVILLPNVYASLLLSGCPAFPSTFACLDLPWTVPSSAAQDFQNAVARFARWYGQPVQSSGAWSWIIPYLTHSGNRLNTVFMPAGIVAILATLLISRIRRTAFRGARSWIFGLACVDFLFVAIWAPDERFAIGAIALLVVPVASAFFFMPSAEADDVSIPIVRHPTSIQLISFALLFSLIAIAYRVLVVEPLDARRWAGQAYGPALASDLTVPLSERWLTPPSLPVVYGTTRTRQNELLQLDPRSSADVVYGAPPLGDQCWGIAIPCSAALTAPLRLRVPARGPSSGFVRADRSD